MKRMRRIVRNENVFGWVDSFLKAGAKLTARSLQLRDHRVGAKKTPNAERPTPNAPTISELDVGR